MSKEVIVSIRRCGHAEMVIGTDVAKVEDLALWLTPDSHLRTMTPTEFRRDFAGTMLCQCESISGAGISISTVAKIPVLVTVEYEERHAGQTAAGIVYSWFYRIETFKRIGLLDNPADMAAKFISIISRHPGKFRRINTIAWKLAVK